jgi:hypothetical protein
MNKDSDSRILPSGEYRDAQNVTISKSEGSDVGALENILGNRALVDINSLLGASVKNLEVIGHFMDVENDRIFFMLTNYNDSSSDGLSNFAPSGSGHYIYCYNIINSITTELVAGNFLNFSKTHRIYGVNMIEDLLFWTDNRNQPRKINVESALNAPSDSSEPYYINEDQISVAKYYPYNPIRLYKKMGPFDMPLTGGTISNTGTGPIVSGSAGIVQIGDKMVVSSPAQTAEHMVVGVTATGRVLVSPDLAYDASSTAMFYRTNMKDVVSEHLPRNVDIPYADPYSDNPFYDATWPGDPNFLKNKFVRFSYRYKFDDGEYSLMAPFTQSAFIPEQDGFFLANFNKVAEDDDKVRAYVSTILDFMENKVNNIVLEIDTPSVVADIYKDYKIKEIQLLYKESDSTNIKVLDNILYTDDLIADQIGSYKFTLLNQGSLEIDDGVYSTTNSGSGNAMTIDVVTDNSVGGGRGYPRTATLVNLGFGYVSGDIITVVSAGTGATFTLLITDDKLFSYDYQSRKPISTIPSDQTTRVYDKVPIRALAQETAGNRIIYGNYINKHTSPSYLDYNVKSSDKLEDYQADTNFSTVQYPNHSLKQNRTYQVGVVLSDRYGRQSDVILSSVESTSVGGYGGSTVFADYRTSAENTSKNVLKWFGDSLKVIFNSQIPSTMPIQGYPGLYSTTNPTGWYSYKIVVKQQQQEYYNVYLPGILNGYPFSTKERAYTSFAALYSDNINKIPKDLVDVGPEQKQFRSGEKLWGRVENFIWTGDLGGVNFVSKTQGSRQYYPNLISDEATKVGTMTDFKLGVTNILRAQNIGSTTGHLTNNFLLSSYNPDIQIGMSVDSDAINTQIITKGKSVEIVSAGSGYSAGSAIATTVIPTGGSGLIVDITVDATGALTNITANAASSGTGYAVGDVISLSGISGTGAMLIISKPVITEYLEYSDTTTTDTKAKMTISIPTTGTVPVNETFLINEEGEDLFYNSSTNPFLAKFKNLNKIGVNNSAMVPCLAVYETEPTFSNLDIYYETSTSGLISELNTDIATGDTTTPFKLSAATGVNDPVLFDFNENDTTGVSNTEITTTFKAVANNASPAFITSGVQMSLVSVFNGGSNVTNQFSLVNKGSGGFVIKTEDTYACSNVFANRTYIFSIGVTLTGFRSQNNFSLNTILQNTGPTISPAGPVSAGSYENDADYIIQVFDAVNGSASTTLNTDFIQYTLKNSDGTPYTGVDFSMRTASYPPTPGRAELWLSAGATPGSYNLIVRAVDGPGAVDDCAISFTVTT